VISPQPMNQFNLEVNLLLDDGGFHVKELRSRSFGNIELLDINQGIDSKCLFLRAAEYFR
jgi:hypothetical protein